VGSLAYVPIRAWQSPGNYLVLAGIFGMLTFIALLMRGYAPTPAVLGTFSSPKITVGLAGITVILVALAVVLRSWT
jgi:hypothetical protein